MEYVRVVNGEIVEYSEDIWNIIDDNKMPDSELIREKGIYPLKFQYPIESFDHSLYLEKSMQKWRIESDRVVRTCYNIIDPESDTKRPILEKATLNPKDEWLYDDINDEVTKTYTISGRDFDSLKDLVENGSRADFDFDLDCSYIEKPVSTWSYCNGIVYPEYWKIVRKEVDTKTSIFYNYKARDIAEWNSDEEFIYEELDFTEKDISEVQKSLKEYSAEYRYMLENSDISYNDRVFKCDRDSQSKMLSLYIMSKFDLVDGVNWKVNEDVANSHSFVYLTKMDIINIHTKMFYRTRALFNVEKVLDEAINEGKNLKDVFDNIVPRYDRIMEEFK